MKHNRAYNGHDWTIIKIKLSLAIKPLTMAARPQSDTRIRQVAFWKKHQSILQNCADLSQTCGMKILVCVCCSISSFQTTQQENTLQQSTHTPI